MSNIIETEFLSFEKKRAIYNELVDYVDGDTVRYIFDEIQRLESIIRDYEIGMKQIVGKMESKTFKTPKNE